MIYVAGEKRNDYAHRVAYRAAYGEIPSGLFVLHSCDNRACVNPKHLRLGGPRENALDIVLRGKPSMSKLTRSTVRYVRSQRGKKTQIELGRELGVHPRTVGEAQRGRTWKEIGARAPGKEARMGKGKGKGGKGTKKPC